MFVPLFAEKNTAFTFLNQPLLFNRMHTFPPYCLYPVLKDVVFSSRSSWTTTPKSALLLTTTATSTWQWGLYTDFLHSKKRNERRKLTPNDFSVATRKWLQLHNNCENTITISTKVVCWKHQHLINSLVINACNVWYYYFRLFLSYLKSSVECINLFV